MEQDLVTFVILQVLGFAAVVLGLFAVLHAAITRADAFTAVDKLTKPKWVGITLAGTVGCALFLLGSSLFILWIAGLVAILVYMVDVRPKVTEVQRGSGR